MEKKYELINPTKTFGTTFYRIRALRDFGNVRKGDVGGFVENEENLSHEGTCWIFDNGIVYENGRISDWAKVLHFGVVRGHGKVCGHGRVYDNGNVSGHGFVCDNGKVTGDGHVLGHGWVCDNGHVCDNGKVFEHGIVSGHGKVCGHGKVYRYSIVRYGCLKTDALGEKNWSQILYNLFGIYPVSGKIILYRPAEFVSENVFKSYYDTNSSVIYEIGKITKCEDGDSWEFPYADPCLYFSDPDHWGTDENTILACEIDISDILCIINGLVLTKKCKTIDVIRRGLNEKV